MNGRRENVAEREFMAKLQKRIAELMEKSCTKKKEIQKNFVGSTDNIRRDLEDGRKGRCHGSRRHVIRYFCQ